MRPAFFTVGPSELYPTVESHVARALEERVPSLSHRSSTFSQFYSDAVENMRALLGIPGSFKIFFLASGTEAMERTIENCVETTSAHVVNGAFAQRYKTIATELGRTTHEYEVPDGEAPDLASLVVPDEVEFITITQNETSTGVRIPFDDVRAFSAHNPKVLIGVDIVSSVPYVAVPWDAVDCAFFSVQKGFGLPAGLGVLCVGPRAFEKASLLAQRTSVGSYHAFVTLEKYARHAQTIETPNVLAIYLLAQVTRDLLEVGSESIRATTERRAARLYEYLEKSAFPPAVRDQRLRSETTIVARTPRGSAGVLSVLKEQGIVVSGGYGAKKDEYVRVANFPAHTDLQFEKLFAVLRAL